MGEVVANGYRYPHASPHAPYTGDQVGAPTAPDPGLTKPRPQARLSLYIVNHKRYDISNAHTDRHHG